MICLLRCVYSCVLAGRRVSSSTQAPSVQQSKGPPSTVFTLIQVAPSTHGADDAGSDAVTEVREGPVSQGTAAVSNGLHGASVSGSLGDVAAAETSSSTAESRSRSLWQSAMRGAVAASSDTSDTRWQRTISKVTRLLLMRPSSVPHYAFCSSLPLSVNLLYTTGPKIVCFPTQNVQ